MKYYFAPVQGHTDAPYRHFHNLIYGDTASGVTFFTPFIRLENGSIRQRDLKDLASNLNEGTHIVPQIIFRDATELDALVEILKKEGVKEIDLNMGCPFPLQTGHGRGAATIADEELGAAVARMVAANPDITFSVKMRLGMTDPDEWKTLIPVLNTVSLSHITVHPRIARQQYGGDLYLDRFAGILSESTNPIVFNGDIRTPQDFKSIETKFPEIAGIMTARGILGRPSLIAEAEQGEWDHAKRIETMLAFHRELFNYYSETLCGDTQILSKIKPFWEYAEEEIGRKAWKNIRKAVNIAKYNSAVAMI